MGASSTCARAALLCASLALASAALHPRRYNEALVKELDANGPRNVFLIWTTGGDTLDELALACIGSVVAAYGNRVYLFANHLRGPDLEQHGWSNANLVHYHPENVMQDTPLYDWFRKSKDMLQSGRFYFSHLTDLMRFALIYRHGGVYFDSDVYVMRQISPNNINKLARSLADSRFFECAVVYFTPRHPFLREVLTHITTVYDPKDWITAGPKPLTTIYNRMSERNSTDLPGQVQTGAWLGLRWRQAKNKFWPAGIVHKGDFKSCEVVHLWGSVARGYFKGSSNNFTYLTGPEKAKLVHDRLEVLKNVPYCKLRPEEKAAAIAGADD